MSKFILILLAVISITFSFINGPCTGITGICIDSDLCKSYGGTFYSGKCPNDPDDIKCCDKIPCKADDGRNGECKFIKQCKGNTVIHKCPGEDDFKCCLFEGSSNGGSSINTYLGPNRIKSSLPEIKDSTSKAELTIQSSKSETKDKIDFGSEILNFKGTSKLEIKSYLLLIETELTSLNKDFIISKTESTNLKVSSLINILGSTISELDYINKSGKFACFNTCLSCNEGPNFNESENKLYHNCQECKEGYYFKFGTNDCYNNETIEKNYFLDNIEKPNIIFFIFFTFLF